MQPDTKAQVASVGKTLGLIAAAGVGVAVVTQLVLPPPPVKTVVLMWDAPDYETSIYEIVSKTNMSQPWQFKTNVVGTNRVTLAADKAQEFFTIRKVMSRANTNEAIYLK